MLESLEERAGNVRAAIEFLTESSWTDKSINRLLEVEASSKLEGAVASFFDKQRNSAQTVEEALLLAARQSLYDRRDDIVNQACDLLKDELRKGQQACTNHRRELGDLSSNESSNSAGEADECPNCGKAVPVHARFCSHCAEPLPDQSELEIQARLVSDGVEVEVEFDAAEILSDWSVEHIQGLKNEYTSVPYDYWGPGEISDHVALESSDPRVTLFFRWLDMYNQQAYRAEGYSCVVNASEAMKWLEENRPEVAKALEEDNE